MAKLGDIKMGTRRVLPVGSLPWMNEVLGPGFDLGAVLCISGSPGAGKTTLSMQICGDQARQGNKVLYISTEQGLPELKRSVIRLCGNPDGTIDPAIAGNFYLEGSVTDIAQLPDFLARNVLPPGSPYEGVRMIVVDSIQGSGVPSTALKKYAALYQFARIAKAHGLVVIFSAHMNKRNEIAGPKTFEHNVDIIWVLRRAYRMRPLFVPKNRCGPETRTPLPLMMDSRGRLVKSPHATARSSTALGYIAGGNELVEGQASVSIPRYGARPELSTPFLPAKKIRQLLRLLATLGDVDLTNMSHEISCYVPGQRRYSPELDLAIAVALLGSFLQQPIPTKAVFVGELDLTRRIRPPDRAYLTALAQLTANAQWGFIESIYVAQDAAERLARMRPDPNGPPICELADIRGVGDLEEMMSTLWPSIFSHMEEPANGAGLL